MPAGALLQAPARSPPAAEVFADRFQTSGARRERGRRRRAPHPGEGRATRLPRIRPVLELETDKATIEVPVVGGRQGRRRSRSRPATRSRVGQVNPQRSRTEPATSSRAAPARRNRPTPLRGGWQTEPATGVRRRARSQLSRGRSSGASRTSRPIARPSGRSFSRAPAADKVVDINRGGRGAGGSRQSRRPRRRLRRQRRRSAADGARAGRRHQPGRRQRAERSHLDRRCESARQAARSRPDRPRRRAGGWSSDEPLPDFSRWGEVERQPLRAVRRKTAVHLTVGVARRFRTSRSTTPADITNLESIRAELSEAGRSRRRRADGDGGGGQDRRDGAQGLPAVQLVDRSRRTTRSSSRNTSTSASPSTPTAACSCRSSGTPTRRT